MLDLRTVVDDLENVRDTLRLRSSDAAAALDPIAELAQERRGVIAETEAKAAARNAASKAMAHADKGSAEFAERRAELKQLSSDVKDLEQRLGDVERRLQDLLVRVPNLPHPSTPRGASEEENVERHVWGERQPVGFEPLAHWDLGTKLGILDFDRAAKLSGPRFTVMLGAGARLERALIGFMMDLHVDQHGYTEVVPPVLVKDSVLHGTGQLPKFATDLFRVDRIDSSASYDLYLSPTAEVQLTNLHAEEIIEAERLPLAYVAATSCFRSEAGSYGKDVRGMIRQHQFDKVELVRIVAPERSLEELEVLTRHAEEVLEGLGLHYRRVELCTGDLGFSAAKTYDLEVWLPSQGKFREISSCSCCTDFQARRARIRFRPERGAKPRLAHTLNGSALAVGRTVVAIVEQYQRADGSVVVPEVLRSRMGCELLTPPR